MANIASQKKRILRSERERRENRRLTSVVKTRFRELESSVDDAPVFPPPEFEPPVPASDTEPELALMPEATLP